MTKTRRRKSRNPIPVALALILVVAVGSFLAVTKDIPFLHEPYVIEAAFKDSDGIKKGSPVRIAGVEVGRVSAVRPTSPGARSATLELAIKKSGLPVKVDATAKIRPRIFLEGNFFVDLSPGRPGSPELHAGGMLPITQTANPVLFSDVLKALKADTRADLRRTFAEAYGAQTNGAGQAFNRSLNSQPAAYKFSAIVSEALLGEQPHDLSKYITAQGVVAQGLDADPQALRDLITNFDRTAGALAAREGDLRAAVHELPVTLHAALPTLSALNRAFPPVRAFAKAALPGIRSTGPTIDAALPLVRQLRGLVSAGELRGLSADLRRATPPLARFAKETVPVLEQLRQLASCTNEVLVPFGNQTLEDKAFPATGRVFEELPKSLVGLAGESRSFDANSQWFKVLGAGGLETVALGNGLFGSTATKFEGVNPPPQVERPPLMADAPCENQQIADLGSNPAPPPATVNDQKDSPAVLERTAKAQSVAVEVLRSQLRAEGNPTKVLDQPATSAQILEGLKALKARGSGK